MPPWTPGGGMVRMADHTGVLSYLCQSTVRRRACDWFDGPSHGRSDGGLPPVRQGCISAASYKTFDWRWRPSGVYEGSEIATSRITELRNRYSTPTGSRSPS